MRLMELTREQAIAEHRKMWNWIADETIRRKEIVSKEDYFETFKEKYPIYPRRSCWCCEYDYEQWMIHARYYEDIKLICKNCPIKWKHNFAKCYAKSTFFDKWKKTRNYKKAALYARLIARLPEDGRSKEEK